MKAWYFRSNGMDLALLYKKRATTILGSGTLLALLYKKRASTVLATGMDLAQYRFSNWHAFCFVFYWPLTRPA